MSVKKTSTILPLAARHAIAWLLLAAIFVMTAAPLLAVTRLVAQDRPQEQQKQTPPAPASAPPKRNRASGVKVNQASPVGTPQTKNVPTSSPSPSPTPAPQATATPTPTPAPTATPTPTPKPTPDPAEVARQQAAQQEEETRRRKEQEERLVAGEAALERERQAAVKAALAKEREEQARKDEALRLELEQKERAAQAERERQEAAAKQEREQREAAAKREQEQSASELAAAKTAQAEAAHKLEEERTTSAERERQAKAEAERLAEEARLAALRAEDERKERARVRRELIIARAREFHFLEPERAPQYVADNITDIDAALKSASAANPRLTKLIAFCDPEFLGDSFTLDVPNEIPLGDLLNQLRYLFKVNFLPDSDVTNLPVQINVTDIPWNLVLRSVLQYNDLDVECGANNTILIVKRTKLASINDNRRKSSPIITDFIKLKYLQPSSGGLVNVAGRSQSGGQNAFETLEAAINKILRGDGDNRGSVSRVPGKNELFISGTAEQLTQIKRLIARADRPGYQVLVQALVYTSNENRIRDIGVQSSIILGTGDLSSLGGLTNQPGGTGGGGTGGGTTTTAVPGQTVPGGVRSLGTGFSQPSQSTGIFGVSTVIGTAQFSVQASLLSQRGVINIQSRPFSLVQDGEPVDLNVGRQIPVVVQAANNIGGGAPGTLEVLQAGSVLQVTPQVAEDETGKPAFITLNLRLESNDVDTSVVTQGVPSVTRRSIQTKFLLKDEQTVVIGGFSADSVSHAKQGVPGVSKIPILGNLFKRKVDSENRDRLYFAIAVRVIPQDAPLNTVDAPSDASPMAVPPPAPQQPSPFTAPIRK